MSFKDYFQYEYKYKIRIIRCQSTIIRGMETEFEIMLQTKSVILPITW
jgi:hypothetical protein